MIDRKKIGAVDISAIVLAKKIFPMILFKIINGLYTEVYKAIIDTKASKEGRRIIKHGLAIHMPKVR